MVVMLIVAVVATVLIVLWDELNEAGGSATHTVTATNIPAPLPFADQQARSDPSPAAEELGTVIPFHAAPALMKVVQQVYCCCPFFFFAWVCRSLRGCG